MLMDYPSYWVPLFSHLLLLLQYLKVLHTDPDPGRVRQGVCQVLFKNNLQSDDKNEPARDVILPLSWSKGFYLIQVKWHLDFFMILENTCTWFDFPRRLFVCYLEFGVILLFWKYNLFNCMPIRSSCMCAWKCFSTN